MLVRGYWLTMYWYRFARYRIVWMAGGGFSDAGVLLTAVGMHFVGGGTMQMSNYWFHRQLAKYYLIAHTFSVPERRYPKLTQTILGKSEGYRPYGVMTDGDGGKPTAKGWKYCIEGRHLECRSLSRLFDKCGHLNRESIGQCLPTGVILLGNLKHANYVAMMIFIDGWRDDIGSDNISGIPLPFKST